MLDPLASNPAAAAFVQGVLPPEPPAVRAVLARGRAFILALGLLGCSRPTSVHDYSAPPPSGDPWIAAVPNPVPATRGAGSTTVCWDTKADSPGWVFVSVNGGPEKSFVDHPCYTKDAKVVGRNTYEFRLYSDRDRQKKLATVKVQRSGP